MMIFYRELFFFFFFFLGVCNLNILHSIDDEYIIGSGNLSAHYTRILFRVLLLLLLPTLHYALINNDTRARLSSMMLQSHKQQIITGSILPNIYVYTIYISRSREFNIKVCRCFGALDTVDWISPAPGRCRSWIFRILLLRAAKRVRNSPGRRNFSPVAKLILSCACSIAAAAASEKLLLPI